LYHYIDECFGLKVLKERRLKGAQINDLNDPFDICAVRSLHYRKLVGDLKIWFAEHNGINCFSKSWNNLLMWAHYANKHKGLCLGFDIPDELVCEVNYTMELPSADEFFRELSTSTNLLTHIDEFKKKFMLTKSSDWNHEEEYRAFLKLENTETDGNYYINFSDQLKLKEVIIGVKSSLTAARVKRAVGDLPGVEVFNAGLNDKRFALDRSLVCKHD